MHVTIKPEWQRFVEEQVKAGRFASAAEVVEAGLARLMTDPTGSELDAAELAEIEESERQIARGEDLDWTQVSARLRREFLGE